MEKVVEDCQVMLEEDYTIIGSKSRNEYIKLKTNKIEAINYIISLFNSNNTLEMIDDFCKEKNIKVDIHKLYEELKRKNLLQYPYRSTSGSEINNLGYVLINKSFNNFEVRQGILKISKCFISVIFLANILMTILITFNFDKFLLLLKGRLLTYNNSYAGGAVLNIFISIIILTFHELGHIIMALSYNIPIHKVGLSLYLGFMPKWFIKFRGLRIAKRKTRIKIYSAGIYFNFTMILLAICLSFAKINIDIYRIFIISNILMILNCITPFSLTDGYFIFSDILKVSNVRYKLLSNMKNMLRVDYIKKNKDITIYFIISFIFHVFKLYITYKWLYCALKEITQMYLIVVIFILVIHFYMLIKKIASNNK